MSKNTQNYLNQIAEEHKFVYTKDIHKKMYEKSSGGLNIFMDKNFRKFGKHNYYGSINNKIYFESENDTSLEDAKIIYNSVGSLIVGKTYIKVVTNKNNTEPFFVSIDDIDVKYKFDLVNDNIKTFGLNYPIVSNIKNK